MKSELLFSQISYQLNGLAMKVHRELGRGFHESIYKDALEVELLEAGFSYEREKPYKVLYRGKLLRNKYYADFVVDNCILVEVKAKRMIIQDHFDQVINYLAVSGLTVALIYNFGEKSLVIKRVAL